MSAPGFASPLHLDAMSHHGRYTTDAFDSIALSPTMDVMDPSHTLETALRKRPKYTRSKTGCLTCRGKKIKCDEMKPVCSRCAHGQRECNWPEAVIAAQRKRATGKDSPDSRPVTAASSLSPSSTPPTTREHSPQNNFHNLNLQIPDGTRYNSPQYASRDSHRSSLPNPLPRPIHSDVVPAHVYYSPSPTSASSTRVSYPLSADVAYASQPSQPSQPPPSLLPTLESSFVPPPLHHVRSVSSLNNSPIDTHHTIRYDTPNSHSPAESQQSPEASSWSGPPPIMHSVPDPVYVNSHERHLMQHFLSTCTTLFLAFPVLDGTNPIHALHMPFIDNPVPTSSREAHKFAVLATASIHHASLYNLQHVSSSVFQEAVADANNWRHMADQQLESAIGSSHEMLNDSSLAAAVMLTAADIMANGERDWDEHLAIGKQLVATRGGAAAVASSPPIQIPAQWGGGVVLSPPRVFLEMLAVYETFGCLGTGEEPTLLSPGNCDWWYMEPYKGSFHLMSVEHLFGISRALVPLIAKVFTLVLRASLVPGALREDPPSPAASPTVRKLWEDASALNYQVYQWGIPLPPAEQRISKGNRAHVLALQILIMREIYSVPPTDQRIQTWMLAVLSLVQDCVVDGVCLGMLWPLLVAGCNAVGATRDQVLDLFYEFKSYYCFQVNTAQRIVEEVWRRYDTHEPRATWRQVAEDCHIKLLII
ncbi:hypothetical protein AURDEDRAFT_180995 [Auricularia subglabra TFB-10046 SS5]|nr:hypothetical protein AURDEDRAFT_180995 [Auricularia subglabra TFB-10046 SS5]